MYGREPVFAEKRVVQQVENPSEAVNRTRIISGSKRTGKATRYQGRDYLGLK